MHKSKGFTLIELLVYIVIAAIIVGLAGQVFLDATRWRMRTTRMLESSMGTADVVTYLQEDIRRAGAKAWLDPVSSSASGVAILPAVYWDPTAATPDSSSFTATTSGSDPHRLDAIEFRSATYNPITREVTGWEQVKYNVDANQVLWRTVTAQKTQAGVDITPLPPPVKMAEKVVAFRLRYGVQANESIVFTRSINEPCTTTLPASSCLLEATSTGATITANSGAQVGGLTPGTEVLFKMMQGAAATSVDEFSIVGGNTYRVEFGLGSNDTARVNFRSDLDYVAVRITPNNDPTSHIGGTDDVLFYPAMSINVVGRSFEFTPSTSGSASIAFKFQMRPLTSGASRMQTAAFTIDKVVVKEMANNAYDWHSAFTTSASDIKLKSRVRAVELSISIMVNSSVLTSTIVIPLINNGV